MSIAAAVGGGEELCGADIRDDSTMPESRGEEMPDAVQFPNIDRSAQSPGDWLAAT